MLPIVVCSVSCSHWAGNISQLGAAERHTSLTWRQVKKFGEHGTVACRLVIVYLLDVYEASSTLTRQAHRKIRESGAFVSVPMESTSLLVVTTISFGYG